MLTGVGWGGWGVSRGLAGDEGTGLVPLGSLASALFSLHVNWSVRDV